MGETKNIYLKINKTVGFVFVVVVVLFFGNADHIEALAPQGYCQAPGAGSPTTALTIQSQQPEVSGGQPPNTLFHNVTAGVYHFEIVSPVTVSERQNGWTNWKAYTGDPLEAQRGRIHGGSLDYTINQLPTFAPVTPPNPECDPNPPYYCYWRIANSAGGIGGVLLDPPWPSNPYQVAADASRFTFVEVNLPANTDMRWLVHSVYNLPDSQGPWTQGDYRLNAGRVEMYACPVRTRLTVNKVVIPGGDTGKFNLQIDGVTAGTGANAGNGGSTGVVDVTPNVNHTVSETAGTGTTLSNYTTTIGGDCASDGTITLAAGQSKVCTITNTRKGDLKIIKNTSPTSANGQFEWPIYPQNSSVAVANGIVTTTNGTGSTTVLLAPTTPGNEYRIPTELTPSLAWSITSASCNNGSTLPNTIIINPGQTTTCTYNNAYDPNAPGYIWLNKTVVARGGVTDPAFFPPSVDGVTKSWSTWITLPPGNHTISEAYNASEYTATISGTGCPTTVGGSMNLPPGEFRICTITNEEKLSQLTITIVVNNTGGGLAQASHFGLKATKQSNGVVTPFNSGETKILDSGVYIVSENNAPNYTKTFSGDCNEPSGNVTLVPGTTKTCTITNTYSTTTLPPPGGCPAGQVWNPILGTCQVPMPPPPGGCPAGQVWDAINGQCVIPVSPPPGGCPAGQVWNSVLGICQIPVPPPPEGCPAGQVWDEISGQCIIDPVPPPSGITYCPTGSPEITTNSINQDVTLPSYTHSGAAGDYRLEIYSLPNQSEGYYYRNYGWTNQNSDDGGSTSTGRIHGGDVLVGKNILPIWLNTEGDGLRVSNYTRIGGGKWLNKPPPPYPPNPYKYVADLARGAFANVALQPDDQLRFIVDSIQNGSHLGWPSYQGYYQSTPNVTNSNDGKVHVRICPQLPPKADNLNIASQDYCIQSPTGIVIFNWTYNGTYNEKKYQFQVFNNSGFTGTPLINRTFSNLNNSSPTTHNQAVSVGLIEVEDSSMMYGKTYYWRVKEQDNSTGLCSDSDPSWNNTSGSCSGWVQGPSYTTPLHAWPTASFTFPNPVNIGTSVPFANNSKCYNNIGQEISCTSYSWNFGDNSCAPQTSCTTSISQNPSHSYSFQGTYNVNLQANDDLGNICKINKPIQVVPVGYGGSPGWRELSPLQ